MKYLTSSLPIVLLILLPFLLHAQGNFESASGGLWSETSRWTLTSGEDSDGIPDDNDAVTIKTGHTITIANNATVNGCNTMTVNTGGILVIGGILTQNGAFTNDGTVTWNTGSFDGTGAITNNGTFNITGGSSHNTAANITNSASGSINWIDNYIDQAGGGQVLTNYGTFTLKSGANSSPCEMDVVNYGILTKPTGPLTISKSIVNHPGATFTTATGSTVTFGTGSSLVNSGTFNLNGIVKFEGGAITNNQPIALNGEFRVKAGTFTFGPSNGFTGSAGTLAMETSAAAGTSITMESGSAFSGKLYLGNGTFVDNAGLTPGETTLVSGAIVYQGSGSPTFTNGLNWTAGTFRGAGVVTVNGAFNGGTTGLHIISDSKEVHFLSAANLSGNYTFSSSGKMVIKTGVAVSFTTAIYTGVLATSLVFEGNNVIYKTGTGTASIKVPTTATGSTLDLTEGIFEIVQTSGGAATHVLTNCTVNTAGGSFFQLGAGTFNLSGTAISGAGTFKMNNNGSVVNFNTGSSLLTKVEIQGTLNDNVGLQPGLVIFAAGQNSKYGGTGSPTFANGLQFTGGTAQNTGSFLGSGVVTVSGGLTNTSLFPIQVQDNKELVISGNASFGNDIGGFTMHSNGKVTIADGGTITFYNSTVAGHSTTLFTIENGGTLIKTSTGTLTFSSTPVSTAGAILIQDGTIDITTNNALGGIFEISSRGALSLSNPNINSTYIGDNIENNGQILSPAGRTLVFTGSSGQSITGNNGTISALNISNINGLVISGNHTVTGAVNFATGKITLLDGELTIGSTTNASASKYFVTSGLGHVVQTVTNSTGVLYPVGPTDMSYNPVTLKQTTGSAAAIYGVNVREGLENELGSEEYVNRQWDINYVSGIASTDVTVQWNSGDVVGSFNSSNCNLAHWNGASWDYFDPGAALCGGSTCSRTELAVSNFSPFGVASGIAFPVELERFEGRVESDGNRLEWSTALESGLDRFDVERSADGQRYETVGAVDAFAVDGAGATYHFLDEKPLASGYYRLKMQDRDGSFSYSPIVLLERAQREFTVAELFPNPARQTANLSIESEQETPMSIYLTDMVGNRRLVAAFDLQVGRSTIPIDLNSVPTGVYLLEVQTEGASILRRLIKQ